MLSKSAQPDAQSVHDVTFEAEYCPATQDTHAVAGFISMSAVPLGHTSHAVIPAALTSLATLFLKKKEPIGVRHRKMWMPKLYELQWVAWR